LKGLFQLQLGHLQENGLEPSGGVLSDVEEGEEGVVTAAAVAS